MDRFLTVVALAAALHAWQVDADQAPVEVTRADLSMLMPTVDPDFQRHVACRSPLLFELSSPWAPCRSGHPNTATAIHTNTVQSTIAIRDLGTLPLGVTSAATAINAFGQVVGWSIQPGIQRAFFWENGVMSDLGEPGVTTGAYGISDSGTVIGERADPPSGGSHAVIWQNGGVIDLGTLGGITSIGFGINDTGQAVGWSYPAPGQVPARGFVWQEGSMIDMGSLGGTPTQAHAINAAGRVVGTSGTTNLNYPHAFVWQSGVMADLDTIDSPYSAAFAINDLGKVVGEKGYICPHATLWDNGSSVDLGTLPGDCGSTARGINNLGEIVGYSYADYSGFPSRAVIWKNGTIVALPTLNGSSRALGINDAGQAVGFSETSAGQHAVLWTTRLGVKGDLNGDGWTDLLLRYHDPAIPAGADEWRHDAWLMNGTTRIGSPVEVSPRPAGWLQLSGVDDFNSDGRSDLVLWEAPTGAVEFWMMNGTARRGAPVPLSGGVGYAAPWKLSATADFNHDYKPDLVWRNFETQKIEIWIMDGTTKTGTVVPVPDQAAHMNWEIVAALDYGNDVVGADGMQDGNTDFLWYNASSGKIVLWFMNADAQRTSGHFTTPTQAGDANWKVLAGGDYGIGPDGPDAEPPVVGSNDVVWRNLNSGRFVVWHLDFAGNRTGGVFTTPNEPSPNPIYWTIVGPR